MSLLTGVRIPCFLSSLVSRTLSSKPKGCHSQLRAKTKPDMSFDLCWRVPVGQYCGLESLALCVSFVSSFGAELLLSQFWQRAKCGFRVTTAPWYQAGPALHPDTLFHRHAAIGHCVCAHLLIPQQMLDMDKYGGCLGFSFI